MSLSNPWASIKAWASATASPKSTSGTRPFPIGIEQVDVSAALVAAAGGDVDYSANPLKAIYVGDITTSGPILSVTMYQDGGMFFVYDCIKGAYIEGLIVGVEGTGTTTAEKLVGLR